MTTLTMKDEKRLGVIQRVYRSELTVLEAARTVGISERQCYRVKARVNKAGAKGWFTVSADGSCRWSMVLSTTVDAPGEPAGGKHSSRDGD
jgi:hypothetical protein